jgi:putative hemolysin
VDDPSLATLLWAIGGLILLSAFLSGAEAALLALTEARVRRYEEDAGKLGWSLRLWLKHPQRVLATLQSGDAIVDVTATVLAAHAAEQLLGPWGVPVAIAGMTLLTLILGKAIPKAIAAHHADRLAIPAMRFIGLLYYPLSVFAIPLSLLSRTVVRLAGGGTRESPPVTEEEIEYMIDLGAREGVIDRNEGELLQSVLEFNDTLVREAMVPRTEIVALSLDIEAKALIETVISGGHSRVPIYEENIDNVIGVLHTKDLFRVVHERGPESLEIKPILRRPFFVPETMKISKLLEEFQTKRSHMAIVVDEFGGTAGLITLEDVLEEIVGDIQDEYDVEEKLITSLGGGRFSVDARISVAELEEQTGLKFPEEEGYDTLAGFVTSRAGKVPEVGEELAVDGLLLKVSEADAKRVARVEISANPEKQAEGREAEAGGK